MKRIMFLIVVLIIAGCAPVMQNPDENSPSSPDMASEPSTALDHPPTDYDRFNEVKREIDYWYVRPPRSIGNEHKMQMMNRLLPLNISQSEKDEYIQKLNSLLLADDPAYLEQQHEGAQEAPPQDQLPPDQVCEGNGTVAFTSAPIHLENLGYILPVGSLTGHHITPTDHGYIAANTWTVSGAKREDNIDKFVDVLAPAAGIVSVNRMPAEFATSTLGDYHIIIRHTCTLYTVFIHVNQISDTLQRALDERTFVIVEAGEVIGRSPGFDFAVYNEEVTLGFINPQTYVGEPWKIHTDDLFVHFTQPIRTQLLEKNLRKAEPRSGKLDYDLDGTIAGNWFVENTNGYQGLPQYNRLIGYWITHLAFVYDQIDPTTIIVSMGDYNGGTGQFAVKGNAPDFAEVTSETGMVKYELVQYGYLDNGKVWDEGHYADLVVNVGATVEGTALVEMLEDRKIKFEVFPGKSASQVSAFTQNAKTYER